MSTKTVMNENCTINDPKKGHFQDTFPNLYKFFFGSFDSKSMHGLGAVDFRICLAPKNHGYSVSAQSYDFVLAWER